jgi:dTDP-glucose 4,6-dehydratase
VNPVGPRGVYDEAKRFSEALAMAYHRVHGMDTKIVRIFNTYGPRMRLEDGRAVPTFLCQALRGHPITVHGDGTQTRSFCYVSDMVDGIRRVMESDRNDPINLGNPVEMTVRDLVDTVLRVTGTKVPVTYEPRPVDDPNVRQPDIRRAREWLGWEPKVGLEEGLGRTVEEFRRRLDAEAPGRDAGA